MRNRISRLEVALEASERAKGAADAKIESLEESLKEWNTKFPGFLELTGIPDLPEIPWTQLSYNSDGLSVWGRNLAFLDDPKFKQAYEKGNRSGHAFASDITTFHVEWRVHVVLWAVGHGMKREGDFVECGVNTGIFGLAIADYYDFATSGRRFFLFDTFCGTPQEQMSEAEREKRLQDNQDYYPDCFAMVKRNFEPYPNMELVRGKVPDSLSSVEIDKVAYLSIDMNVAEAEKAALEYFWDKLVPGAVVVLDDYGWEGCETQYAAHNDFARRMGVSILALPTGQGIIVKP